MILYHRRNDADRRRQKYPEDLSTSATLPAANSTCIGTIKGTVVREVRTETILKIYSTLIVPTLLYGSENWTVTASKREEELKLQK